ncbi:alpha-amylase family glycosyl hydrolase [Gilvibacter sp.]|uniref:alpha-amylase family glycosyl hydrolase n=1 Tax=Gilvibacter sp. TaxID=2729997 RepID=UPI0035BE82F0
MRLRSVFYVLLILALTACKQEAKETVAEAETQSETAKAFDWKAANLYFLLTDRFNNGDTTNDVNFERNKETAVLRGFEGGDLKGITQKIEEGYFSDLGINAIWMTPIVEQVHDGTDEGTGYTYAYHGYWTKDWTQLDPNFGTFEDLAALVEAAHSKGIRILLDAVINHTGPVTEQDAVWPEDWVRTEPTCTYTSYETTVECTLVKNLPDIKTESNEDVELPPALVAKWKAEGRYETEMAELDAFFARTGYPRAPRFYIMKWLTDYITDFGIDGYRVDTVRHTEAYVWQEFKKECDYAFNAWKEANPDKVLDNAPFYTVGEVYGYGINDGLMTNFGDVQKDYYKDAFTAMINFDLRSQEADVDYEAVFSRYDSILNTTLADYGTLSYLTSHDDGYPFDKARENTYTAANLLLLTPGGSQMYYGDEVGRSLLIEGTNGDATLRSAMDWEAYAQDAEAQRLLTHYQKLGQFKNNHLAVGIGRHQQLAAEPYTFSRTYADGEDTVVVALNAPKGSKIIEIGMAFAEGATLRDAYTGKTVTVKDGQVSLTSDATLVLLEAIDE